MIKYYIFIIILVVFCAVLVSAGFSIVGSPETTKNKLYDTQRMQALSTLANAINIYDYQNGYLPQTLQALPLNNSTTLTKSTLIDPQTRRMYDYIQLNPYQYKLCATFTYSSGVEPQSYNPVTNYGSNVPQSTTHKAGYDCIQYAASRNLQQQYSTYISPTITLPGWKNLIGSINNYGIGLSSPTQMVQSGSVLWVIEKTDPQLVQLVIDGSGSIRKGRTYALPSIPNSIGIVNKQLWIGIGRQIYVYDASNPTTILKTISDSHLIEAGIIQQVGETVWIVDSGNNVIELFTLDGVYTGKQVPIGQSSFISALAYINNTVWATDANSNQIRIIDPTSLQVTKNIGNANLNFPQAIVQAGSYVLVANSTGNNLSVFDVSGNQYSQPINDPSIGNPISLTANGKTFFILNSQTDSITKMILN